MRPPIKSYPRTYHLEGSRLSEGSVDATQISFSKIKGLFLTIEEKIDGSNTAISFSSSGELLLQFRENYLDGKGLFEEQFNLFKAWATTHQDFFFDVLGSRYVMYGEWCYKKHTVFYNALPHYFLEFDVYDRVKAVFLSTSARKTLLSNLPVESIPVVGQGTFESLDEVKKLVRSSLFKKAGWRPELETLASGLGLEREWVWKTTDTSDLSEGLYIKVENPGKVLGRYKWIRYEFVERILKSGEHVGFSPTVPNQLLPEVDIWSS